jgi:hypothetical protein
VTAVALFMLAHSWYPNECCHDIDCHPIACSELQIDGKSASWRGHGRQAMPSPDNSCHICIHGNLVTCVFIPEHMS